MSKPDKEKKASEKETLREKTESNERVSGEPDSNLAAIGGGGITGAAAGAVVGTAIGGPIGAAVGAAVGAVAGAAAADKIQDELDPKLEEVYWEQNFKQQPYYKQGDKYETYLPAYRFGWEWASKRKQADRDFESLEPDMRNEWQANNAHHGDWTSVRPIIRDAFIRVREKRHTFGQAPVNK